MTARYALFEIENLRDRFQLASGVPKGVKKHYNISPTQSAPVIVNRNGTPQLELMKWGFIPAGAKDANSVFRYKTFNARSEGIFEKPTWKNAIRSGRCLVPANGFYEWRATKDGKQPFFIRPQDQTLCAFAGLYSSWTDLEGVEHGIFAIITTIANQEMYPVSDRMPVIVRLDDQADWLNLDADDTNAIHKIMRPADDNTLQIDKVGQDINSIKLDKPHLITPLVKA